MKGRGTAKGETRAILLRLDSNLLRYARKRAIDMDMSFNQYVIHLLMSERKKGVDKQ